MRSGYARGRALVLFFACLCLAASTGTAAAQMLLPYAGNGCANKITDSLTLCRLAGGAIESNHRTIAGWYLGLTLGTVSDAVRAMPNAAIREEMAIARARLRGNKPRKALKRLKRAKRELDALEPYWKLEGAETAIDSVINRIEAGDASDALVLARTLERAAAMEPLQGRLMKAGDLLRETARRVKAGHAAEALSSLESARASLRKAYVEARLVQARVIVSYAARLLRRGKSIRARWAMKRAARKIESGEYLAAEAVADAMGKIRGEIDGLLTVAAKRPAEGVTGLRRVEAKITALFAKVEE